MTSISVPTAARARLQRDVAGPVFDGASTEAAAEAAGFNRAVTHAPAVVVGATRPADVAAAVRFAAEADLPVAVQATGHGLVRSADGAVLITTSRMQGVRVDPIGGHARVAAGVRWRAVIDTAAPHGLAPLSGSSSSVGVVGYTLGGGMGHLARRYGFAADRVRGVEIVTADGAVRHVTAGSDPELFWALRGGQGNFGIVTALEFDLVPVPEFFGGNLVYPAAATRDVLQAFAEWAPTLPEAATTSFALLRVPDLDSAPPPLRGRFVVALRFGYAGAAARGAALIAPMRDVARPLLGRIGPMSYRDVDDIHMDPKEPGFAVDRGGLLRAFDTDVIDALLAAAGPQVDVPLGVVEVRLMGGALSRPAAVPNAVAGRDGAYSVWTLAPAPPPLAAGAPAAAASVLDAVHPWLTGTSMVNFLGHAATPDQVAAAWSCLETVHRLRRLKAEWDPANMFRGGHALAPAVPAGVR
jgi:FAD/FMN-containing dehydrogenase